MQLVRLINKKECTATVYKSILYKSTRNKTYPSVDVMVYHVPAVLANTLIIISHLYFLIKNFHRRNDYQPELNIVITYLKLYDHFDNNLRK